MTPITKRVLGGMAARAPGVFTGLEFNDVWTVLDGFFFHVPIFYFVSHA